MIDKEHLLSVINNYLNENGYFLVEFTVSSKHKIYVEVDADQGIPISFCVSLSNLIESSIDREQVDFELEVASATLGQPFKVYRQYQKNLGKEVAVLTKEGVKEEGILSEINEERIVLKTLRKLKEEGSKKKVETEINLELPFTNIKETKNIIRFK